MAARPAPGLWPLKDAQGWQWHWCLQAHILGRRNPLSLHFQSWILQNHNIFYMKILKLSIVSETWSMGHCMGQGTTPHPDSPPTEDFENMFVHERVSDLKSCKMSLIQISTILTRLQLTRVKKCEAAGLYLPSAQSGVHGFTAAGWLLTDSAPATKIKIYYNVKLNLIKCEQLAPAQPQQTVCVSCHSSWWIVAATFLM